MESQLRNSRHGAYSPAWRVCLAAALSLAFGTGLAEAAEAKAVCRAQLLKASGVAQSDYRGMSDAWGAAAGWTNGVPRGVAFFPKSEAHSSYDVSLSPCATAAGNPAKGVSVSVFRLSFATNSGAKIKLRPGDRLILKGGQKSREGTKDSNPSKHQSNANANFSATQRPDTTSSDSSKNKAPETNTTPNPEEEDAGGTIVVVVVVVAVVLVGAAVGMLLLCRRQKRNAKDLELRRYTASRTQQPHPSPQANQHVANESFDNTTEETYAPVNTYAPPSADQTALYDTQNSTSEGYEPVNAGSGTAYGRVDAPAGPTFLPSGGVAASVYSDGSVSLA